MPRFTCTLVVVLAFTVIHGSFAPPAQAQDAPATLPSPADLANAPTTRPRHEAQLPPGFERRSIEGRDFFLEPADEQWVSAAVAESTPATLPTTMPGNILDRLEARRGTIKQQLVADVGLNDAEVDAFFDQRLKAFLLRMDELRPPIIYLVATPQRLREVMKAGWTDPLYYYNRAADDVTFRTVINLSLDDAGDDTVIPILSDAGKPPEERRQLLVQTMRATEARILQEVSQRSEVMAMVAMVELVSSQALGPLKLKGDQEWFGVGAAGVLGARYAAELTGRDARRMLSDMTRPDPRNPMRPDALDLLHPMNLNELRPEALSAYVDAYRRRSMQVVSKLVEQAGDGAIGKVIAAIKQSPPADGPALVQVIKQVTGVDLTADLARRG